jgi:DNA-binding transcriptional regulator YiaG
MTSKARFKTDAFEAIYSGAQGLHRAGTIDQATMRAS